MTLVLVFKILVKYMEINAKIFISKKVVKSITFAMVFGTYYLVVCIHTIKSICSHSKGKL